MSVMFVDAPMPFIESSAFRHFAAARNSAAVRTFDSSSWKRSRSMNGEDEDEKKACTTYVRTAHDAGDDARLEADPADEDAKLDVALDESFPTSDPPSNTQPGKGKDPAPSSGYDEDEEKRREDRH
ncbi:hypothetical protein [Rhizorhabdus phycosphaerae]|uniref:hypothetical protein n=1 Tax=Rhizorhabdus phycosphaerae TaxID=2711156 RepID=UPI001D004A0F|nr:hypothetical protein [Rhizorhabdus phycosphaerae]